MTYSVQEIGLDQETGLDVVAAGLGTRGYPNTEVAVLVNEVAGSLRRHRHVRAVQVP